jgi:hypothetical protein
MAVIDIETIEQSLYDNLDFEESNSVAKAMACVTAAKRWLVFKPGSASSMGHSMTMNASAVQEILRRAQEFVAARDTTRARTRFFSMENYR